MNILFSPPTVVAERKGGKKSGFTSHTGKEGKREDKSGQTSFTFLAAEAVKKRKKKKKVQWQR